MSTKVDLEELLARATALETALEAKSGDPEILELKAQVAELAQTMDAVVASLDDLAESGLDAEEFGDPAPTPEEIAAAAEADATLDVLEAVESADGPVVEEEVAEKSWSACGCGSLERNEYKDGTASCDDCGAELMESKGVDFADMGDDVFDEADLTDDEVKSVRDYIRAPNGEFASSGSKDSSKPAPGSRKLPGDAERYDVNSLDAVRSIMRNWTKVPLSARADLKKKLETYLSAHTGTAEHTRLRALVGGLGNGDGIRQAGEGSGRAVAEGRANQWLANHKGDEEPLETKSGDGVELTEFELMLARRAAL